MKNGYSIVVFSNFFQKVKGIDLFNGDFHSELKTDHYKVKSISQLKYKILSLSRQIIGIIS